MKKRNEGSEPNDFLQKHLEKRERLKNSAQQENGGSCWRRRLDTEEGKVAMAYKREHSSISGPTLFWSRSGGRRRKPPQI